MESKIYSRFCDRLVKIDTIGDGNCLIHSILKSAHDEYQENADLQFRIELAREIRVDLARIIVDPDPRFSNEQSVVTLIKEQYKTYSPRNFLEFLRIMYKYDPKYIEYPVDPTSYLNKGSYIDLGLYTQYIEEYKTYLYNFYDKIQNKRPESVKAPRIDICMISENEPSQQFLEENDIVIEAYKEMEALVDYEILCIKYVLEQRWGDNLYLPSNFDEGIIEKILNNDMENLQGRYDNFPYNCYLFTCCNASNLMKLEWEYHQLEGITYLKDIPEYLKSYEFIGESDALPYLPELMGVNLIILNFDNNKIINVYENNNNDKFVLIHNQNNRHFESVGFTIESNIWTLFEREHPIIKECLESIKRDNKELLFNELDMESPKPKVINFMKDSYDKQKDVVTILRRVLGDRAEIDYCNEFDAVAYVRYQQTPKTIYRFYVDDKGEITSGTVTNKIKQMIRNILS
jgi:hypothetical protein